MRFVTIIMFSVDNFFFLLAMRNTSYHYLLYKSDNCQLVVKLQLTVGFRLLQMMSTTLIIKDTLCYALITWITYMCPRLQNNLSLSECGNTAFV